MLFTVMSGVALSLAVTCLAHLLRDLVTDRAPDPMVALLCLCLFTLAAVCYDSGSAALAAQALAACEPTI